MRSALPAHQRSASQILCPPVVLLGSGFILLTAGCSGSQSALNPRGIQAAQISNLWWFFFLITAAVYLVVLLFLVGAILKFWGRPAPRADGSGVIALEPGRERRFALAVGSAVGITVLLLFILLMSDVFAGASLHKLASHEPLTIKVTGHQWWWEIEYEYPSPSSNVTTANEIHLPVGKAIQFKLNSPDVIHSFWVPNLSGKKDLIPGHPTAVWMQADQPGTYYGQCAEYCGFQHAHMRFVVVAESAADFAKWISAQRQPAPEPRTDREKRGRDLFLSGTCVMCHSIDGTIAGARLGPNLTHVASRKLLAAGTLHNNRGSLGGWILDPQQLKPGVKMPQNVFNPSDFHALLDYLQSLK